MYEVADDGGKSLRLKMAVIEGWSDDAGDAVETAIVGTTVDVAWAVRVCPSDRHHLQTGSSGQSI